YQQRRQTDSDEYRVRAGFAGRPDHADPPNAVASLSINSRSRPIIDKDASSPICCDFPFDQQLRTGHLYPGLFQQYHQRIISFDLEDAFNKSTVFILTHQVLGSAFSQQYSESIDDDRFSRTCLSAQHIEPGLEFNLNAFD